MVRWFGTLEKSSNRLVQTARWSVADYERVKVYAGGTGVFDGKHVFSAEIQSYARF